MKRLIQTILATGAVVFVAAVSSANAQVLETIRFSTTFPFTVGNKTFPAGNYSVRPLEGQLDVMEISNGTSTSVLRCESSRFTAGWNEGPGHVHEAWQRVRADDHLGFGGTVGGDGAPTENGIYPTPRPLEVVSVAQE